MSKKFLIYYKSIYMAEVAKWLTHLTVNQGFRGFDSHFPPHINNKRCLHLSIKGVWWNW